MAVTKDVSGGTIVAAANGSASFTVANNSNRLLLACVYHDSAADGSFPSAVTWNGTAMTRVTSFDTHDGVQLHLYKLIAPATGAHTLSVTGASGADKCGIKYVSLYDVDQTTPLGTAVTHGVTSGTNDQSPSVTITGAVNGLSYAFLGGWNQALASVTLTEDGSGQSIVDTILTSAGDNMSLSTMAGATTNAFAWTMNKGGANFIDSCAIGVCALPVSAGAAFSSPPPRSRAFDHIMMR